MKLNVEVFRKVVANAVIVLVVAGVFGLSLSGVVPASGSGNRPIYKGTSADRVSLMVNVYWGTEYLDGMLKTLDKHNVTTTFFVGGSWVNENEEMLKRIAAAGHEIGNHGYFHKAHDKLNAQRNRDEITAAHSLVRDILGIEMTLFAPPSGAFNQTTLDAASSLGYTTVMWTRDTVDWRDRDTKLIVKRATKNTAGGDLILMHPTANTAEALETILVTLKEKNLTVAPVSRVI
ncbi:MAG: polysaccharide deacetylase family protein [Clostridiales bacterium]|jgi:peptidoglycan/xylan/chitin deacetylase (PgdA/CDA1 family)|nr:polysaccharide deacetylase family protein [Clostridiales bacterium]